MQTICATCHTFCSQDMAIQIILVISTYNKTVQYHTPKQSDYCECQ